MALALEVNFWVMNMGVEDLKYQWLIFDLEAFIKISAAKKIFFKKS